MLKLSVLVIVAFCVVDYACGFCEVSPWGEWTEWNYPNHISSIQSFPVTVKNFEKNERNRERKGRDQEAHFWEFSLCLESGTCPEFVNHQVDGFAPCEADGFARTPTANYSCLNVDHMAFIPTSELFPDETIEGSKAISDIWGWVDPLNADEYAIVGLTDGTTFVRVTDPNNPVVLGHLKTAGPTSVCCRDMKVFNNYAFVVADEAGHGMQVFDLTRLRSLTGQPPERLTADAYYGGTGDTHNMVASPAGFVYLCGSTNTTYENNCNGGLHVLDVSDPLNPTFVTCYGDDGYVHDCQCVIYSGPDVTHLGKEICVCFDEDTLNVFDVTDKAAIVQLSRTGYQEAEYTHQGWMTADQTLLVMDDEYDEANSAIQVMRTYLWDMSDLDAPVLVNTYLSDTESIDHDQYVLNDLTYQSNLRAGMKILHINRTSFTLSEVANFDVAPFLQERVGTGGSWGNFVFSPEKVVVGSYEMGLYVLQPDMAAIEKKIQELANQEPIFERRRFRNIVDTDDITSCPKMMEIETME